MYLKNNNNNKRLIQLQKKSFFKTTQHRLYFKTFVAITTNFGIIAITFVFLWFHICGKHPYGSSCTSD